MLLAGSISIAGAADILNISLADSEKSTLANSPQLKSLVYEQSSAEFRAGELKTQYYPRLSLAGTYRYVSEIQTVVTPFPALGALQLGEHENYSVGPQIDWTAWDSGARSNMYKSASMAAEAMKLQAKAAESRILLSARTAYFRVALAGEQVTLYADSLKLANSQYNDIKINVHAGTRSLADELSAHQQVLARLKQLRQARADMASALRDLAAITGQDYPGNISAPLDSRSSGPYPELVSKATSIVKLESIDSLLERFEPYAKAKLNENHPGIKAYSKSAEAAGFAKSGAESDNWPKLQLLARTSLDYPNGNQPDSYSQNTLGATLNWTWFDSGLAGKRAAEQESVSNSALELAKQAKSDYARDWNKMMDQLANLEEQRNINDIAVSETTRLQEIIYKSYKAGSATYLQVEDADFKSLEAKIDSALTKVQILQSLAVMASLSE
jgi:outer membrane protein TolC